MSIPKHVPLVKNAGSTEMKNNPKVSSSFDRNHGKPASMATVASPGQDVYGASGDAPSRMEPRSVAYSSMQVCKK